MDRLKREGNPPVGQLASPIPQYKRPGSTDYDPVEGQNGAPFATLKDASGNVVSPATEDKLEQVRQLLTGVATEAKLEQARGLLASISGKDFATQTTLAQVQSELALVKTELETIKANQTSGNQKVTLSGTIASTTNARKIYEKLDIVSASGTQSLGQIDVGDVTTLTVAIASDGPCTILMRPNFNAGLTADVDEIVIARVNIGWSLTRPLLTTREIHVSEKAYLYFRNDKGSEVNAKVEIWGTTAQARKERFAEIGRGNGVTVNNGETTMVTPFIDTQEFPFHFFTVRTSANHAFKVFFEYASKASGSLGAPMPNVMVLDSTTAAGDTVRKYPSEWIETKGTRVRAHIQNLDEVPRTYDFVLFGVR